MNMPAAELRMKHCMGTHRGQGRPQHMLAAAGEGGGLGFNTRRSQGMTVGCTDTTVTVTKVHQWISLSHGEFCKAYCAELLQSSPRGFVGVYVVVLH